MALRLETSNIDSERPKRTGINHQFDYKLQKSKQAQLNRSRYVVQPKTFFTSFDCVPYLKGDFYALFE
jgi:hypothetical protein